MGKKPGIYVCGGCGIAGALDTQKLVELARAPAIPHPPQT